MASDATPDLIARAPPRLTMAGVHKRFGATAALAGVDLSVRPGEVLALVGENGAGKSTLMKILSGAHRPDAGTMTLDGNDYAPRDPMDARQAGVAMIYQELALAPHLSVTENVLLGIEPTAGPVLNWRRMREVAAGAMRQLGRPDISPDTRVSRLSIADQQLVEIARAVAIGSKVLVLDEPTSSLTREDVRLLFALVGRLKSQGLSIIYISHFLEEVREIADAFTVLRDGKTVGGGRTADVPNSRIVAMMVGRDVTDLYPRSPRTPGEELLSTTDLAADVKPLAATLSLRRGEVLGIAGLIGTGRTELLRAIFGLNAVRDGEVRVGTFAGPASPATRWAQGVGMVSEDRKTEGLATSLSVADNMTLSRLDGLGLRQIDRTRPASGPAKRGEVRRSKGLAGLAGFVSPARQAAVADHWIGRLGIRCRSPEQPVGSLSGGNQQKVAIARLLYHDVDVLLLDEPTRGIDVGSKAEIYRLIDALARGDASAGRLPKAVLMVSSYLPELLGTCDRIAVMCRGVLGPAKPVGQWDEHAIMLAATGDAGVPRR